MSGRAALVLPGGGARGAYQVGVLKALAELLPGPASPFPIISGISAGAINAGVLASHADDFAHATARLEHFWGELRCARVYRSGWLHNLKSGLHWLAALTLGGLGVANPRALFDNRPLAELLEAELDVEGISRCLNDGSLDALMITASGYSTNRAVTFFQAADADPGWRGLRRIGRRARIDHRHLLASAALPLLFPAQRLDHEYYGDGGMRQTAPLKPALHRGADRLLIIGTRDEVADPEPVQAAAYPSLGDIGGHLLDVIFMDHITSDLERLQRVNRLLGELPPGCAGAAGLRPVRSLLIRPSQDLRQMAARHAQRIPASVRTLLRGIGAWGSGRMAGFLLFEAEFCRELIELGYQDGIAAADEVRALLT
ncbi:MAG: patatin-like phospholipase family protein [Wenzhouxiangellaceae bacterium]|nr:MAG: patatin-like phospholipase family protein [Wenzhouxiangellaceae bacterium]